MSATLTNLQQRDLILLQKQIKREDERFKEEVLEVYDNYSRFVSRHIINGINRRLPNKLIIETLEIPETYDKMLEIRITRYQRRIVYLLNSFSKVHYKSYYSINHSSESKPTFLSLLVENLKDNYSTIKDINVIPIVNMLKKTYQYTTKKVLEAKEKIQDRKDILECLAEIKEKIQNKFNSIKNDIQRWIFNKLLLWKYRETSNIIAVEFFSVVDEKTSDICRANNGIIIDINDKEKIRKYLPPLHPNCRSYLRPIYSNELQEKINDSISKKPLILADYINMIKGTYGSLGNFINQAEKPYLEKVARFLMGYSDETLWNTLVEEEKNELIDAFKEVASAIIPTRPEDFLMLGMGSKVVKAGLEKLGKKIPKIRAKSNKLIKQLEKQIQDIEKNAKNIIENKTGKTNKDVSKNKTIISKESNFIDSLLSNPKNIWGKSETEITKLFKKDGYHVILERSTKGSKNSLQIRIKGHKTIQNIQVHLGGGRHGGRYYKISTTNMGIIKVVDKNTYIPTINEKATIIYVN